MRIFWVSKTVHDLLGMHSDPRWPINLCQPYPHQCSVNFHSFELMHKGGVEAYVERSPEARPPPTLWTLPVRILVRLVARPLLLLVSKERIFLFYSRESPVTLCEVASRWSGVVTDLFLRTSLNIGYTG